MEEIIFLFNNSQTTIQCRKNETMKVICQRFATKIGIELSTIYFLYGGKKVDYNLTLNNVLKEDDKKLNKINILAYSYSDNNNINKAIENSKDIICPKCGEKCLIKINDYKINLFKYKNNHNLNNISLDEFQNSQKIDLSKIICNDCKNNNKSTPLNFYKCFSCKKDLCPMCLNRNHKEHEVIEYDKKNYICSLHNEFYSSYCKKCNENLCMFCESEHKDKENIIYYRDILPKKDLLKNQINELRTKIDKYKEMIGELKKLLDKFIENLEIYYNINNNIFKNFEKKNKNFQILKNMSEIINNNNFVFQDLNVIINDNNNINKFNKIIKLFNKINDKNTINNEKKDNIFNSNNIINNQQIIKNIQNNQKIAQTERKNNENKVVEIKKEQNTQEKKILLTENNEKTNKNNNIKNVNNNNNENNSKKDIYSKNIYNSMLAEQCSRYEEMVEFLEVEFKQRDKDFNSDERNLYGIACKNYISSLRSAMWTILAYENKEKKKEKSNFLSYIIMYKEQIRNELIKRCQRVIKFIEEFLFKRAKNDEAIVFYIKMKADYNKYIAESFEGNIKKQATDISLKAYEEAMKKI